MKRLTLLLLVLLGVPIGLVAQFAPRTGLLSVPVSRTIFVDINGNDTTAVAGDASKPCQTIGIKAVALATSLTPTAANPVLIRVGPGSFTENAGIALPPYVSIQGGGIDVTIVKSVLPYTSGGIVSANTNSLVEGLTINGTLTDGTYQFPIAVASNTVSGVTLNKVKTSADSDGVYGVGDDTVPVFLRAFNCLFVSKFDGVNITRGTAEFYNCVAIVTGPSATGQGIATGVAASQDALGHAGKSYWYGGSVTVDGGTDVNSGFETRSNGKIYAFFTHILRGSSALSNYDLNSSAGSTIRYSAITKDDGTALVKTGGAANIDVTNTVAVLGTTTNDNAAAGNVGEYVSASVVQGSAVSLTTATPKTVTSISLTAGDWDVTAIGALTGASTGTEFDVAVGTTTNSLTGTVLGNTRAQTPTVSLTGADASLMIPAVRVSISSTTTYYMIVQETFTVGTPSAYGRISARRVR